MTNFEKNIALIAQRNVPDFIKPFDQEDIEITYMGTDYDGVKIFLDSEEKPFLVDCQIDKASLPNPNLKQIVFFFGIVSLNEIYEISKKMHKETLLILIEPKPYFLQHVLEVEDFTLLKDLNYIIVTEKPSNLSNLFRLLFSNRFLFIAKNPVFYLNSYYRQKDADLVRTYIREIGTALKHKYFTMGNSIHDSLIGLINNLKNISMLEQNPDVGRMKDLFKGYPAFVISAGPSLDKNIARLKEVNNRGIIIAVDTIVEKLVNNGIIPHFICTVEREAIVYDYFYEKQVYPEDIYLVAPPVVDPRIVEKFPRRAVLPMRETVREYLWLAEMLGLSDDYFAWMGGSCAHLAMGMALHLGASPVVLVGQDLAFGGEKSHANGTIYESKPLHADGEELMVPGYHGGEVMTRKVWHEFKLIFENKISEISNLVINATEGGARIEGTVQHTLAEVIETYCKAETDVVAVLKTIVSNTTDWTEITMRIEKYINLLEQNHNKLEEHIQKLNNILEEWSDDVSGKKLKSIYRTMKETDSFLNLIVNDQLLHHNVQGPLIVLLQKFYNIEENDTTSSLRENLLVQIELCNMLETTSWFILQVLEENFPWRTEVQRG